MLLVATWKYQDGVKSQAATYLAMTTPEVSTGDCSVVGRWHNLGEGTGTCILEALSVENAYKWIWNVSEDFLDVKIDLVIDGNEYKPYLGFNAGSIPPFDHGMMSMEPPEGHSLFKCSWGYHAKHGQGNNEEDFARTCSGRYGKTPWHPTGATVVCRFHDLDKMGGFLIAALPVESATKSLEEWTKTRTGWADVRCEPVLMDEAVCRIVTSKPGYEKKVEEVEAAMDM